jgi:hypothetical protein
MKELNLNELEIIGGTNDTYSNFCAGFTAGAIVYGAGVLANFWNPVGWGGGAAILAIEASCLINEI